MELDEETLEQLGYRKAESDPFKKKVRDEKVGFNDARARPWSRERRKKHGASMKAARQRRRELAVSIWKRRRR